MKFLVMAVIAFVGIAMLSGWWMPRTKSGGKSAVASAEERAVSSAPGNRVPVIVELFTSEGCSSCPPADQVLAELDAQQPIEGAEVLALSEHVDYWNYIGWTDPFSSAAFSARQEAYAGAFGTERIYTPQMIVDGQTEFVGSSGAKARDAIGRAIRASRAEIQLTSKVGTGGAPRTIAVQIRKVPSISSGDVAEVLFAITESRLASKVSRGENSGRQLPHTGVVRELRALGSVDPATRSFTGELQPMFAEQWKRENLRGIVFVQERSHRRILGAASLRFAQE